MEKFNLYLSLGKISRRKIDNIFRGFFSWKIGFDISCKLSPKKIKE